jgi:hypothetical protein
MVGTVTTSGRKPSRRARALRVAVRAAGLEASEGSATQYGSSRHFLARTDSNSHASAPHKLMIQNHLQHALSAIGIHFALQPDAALVLALRLRGDCDGWHCC